MPTAPSRMQSNARNSLEGLVGQDLPVLQVAGSAEVEVGGRDVDPGSSDDLDGLGRHVRSDPVAADHCNVVRHSAQQPRDPVATMTRPMPAWSAGSVVDDGGPVGVVRGRRRRARSRRRARVVDVVLGVVVVVELVVVELDVVRGARRGGGRGRRKCGGRRCRARRRGRRGGRRQRRLRRRRLPRERQHVGSIPVRVGPRVAQHVAGVVRHRHDRLAETVAPRHQVGVVRVHLPVGTAGDERPTLDRGPRAPTDCSRRRVRTSHPSSRSPRSRRSTGRPCTAAASGTPTSAVAGRHARCDDRWSIRFVSSTRGRRGGGPSGRGRGTSSSRCADR